MNGTFLAKIADHVLREVGEKKTPSVSISFDLIQNIDTTEAEFGKAYADLWLSPACFERTIKTLQEACGWTGNDIAELNGTGLLADREVWLVLGEEEYNGKHTTKVKFINRVGVGGKKKPMEDDKTKKLAESLKGKILSFRQKNPVQAQPAGSVGSDGLPF